MTSCNKLQVGNGHVFSVLTIGRVASLIRRPCLFFFFPPRGAHPAPLGRSRSKLWYAADGPQIDVRFMKKKNQETKEPDVTLARLVTLLDSRQQEEA